MPLTNNTIWLFSVVREAVPGGGVWTNYAEQDNRPTVEEVSAPSSGVWSWALDDDGALLGGFIGSPTVTVTPVSADGRIVEVAWSGIVASDWRNGVSGTFTANLTDGAGNHRGPYTIMLKTRSIEHIDFTVLQGQTSAGDNPVHGAAAGETHVWTASDTPPGTSVTFTSDGRISATFAGDWSVVNGTFALTLGNGAGKPDSTFDGTRTGGGASLPRLKLRKLIGDGYTIFQGQSGSGDGISGPSAETYLFTPSSLPSGCTLTLDNRGRVSAATSPDWSGASDGTFALEVKDGTRPNSYFAGAGARHINFRAPIGNGFTYVHGQTSSGPCVNAPGALGFIFTVCDIGPGASLTLDAMGCITSAGGPSDATFDLEISDGGRPPSQFTGWTLEFRTISDIKVPASSSAFNMQVNAEAGNWWDWQGFSETLPVTQLTASLGPSTTGMTLTPTVLEPGEHGHATIKLQKQNAVGNPIRPFSIVSTPISCNVGVRLRNTADSHTLPGGRGRMRYQAELEALTSMEAGMELVWSADFSGAPDLASVLTLATSIGSSTFNVLQTPYDSVAGTSTYLPNTTGTRTFTVTVVKRNAATLEVCATSGAVSFYLPILESKDNLNVAVLLDRSGSMSLEERWPAACSAAAQFAVLVSEAVASGRSHKLGVYWFNSAPNPAAAFQNADGDSYAVNTGVAIADAATVGTTCAASGPAKCTALGTGMLLCRDELSAASGVNDEKVLLVLSDGMENQAPLTTSVFFDAASPNYWGSPHVRIYPIALMTADAWVERLRTIVAVTGGLSALDVASIPTWTVDTPHKITNWFITMFCELFGFTQIVSPPDPALTKGKSALQPVQVNLGQTKVVFYVTHDTPRPSDWRFTLQLPGGKGTITKEIAERTDGINYFETEMSKMYIVDFPLKLSGLEYCWAGIWNMEVGRVGDGTGHFGAGALAQQDIRADVKILFEASPYPGDTAVISAALTGPDGKPILDAKAATAITPPGAWSGDQLTKIARKTPELYRTLGRSKSAVNLDIDNPSDKLWRHLLQTQKPKRQEAFHAAMKHVGNGIYTASFKVMQPGEYTVDVTFEGIRTSPQGELSIKKQLVRSAREALLRAKNASIKPDEIDASHQQVEALFEKSVVATAQRFRIETRRTVTAGFAPDGKQSTSFGYLENQSTICLFVEPKDTAGRLLGPGWADGISFIAPIGRGSAYPSKDLLDGTYEVEICMNAADLHISLTSPSVIGNRLALIDPKGVEISLKNKRLPLLDGFFVDVLGQKMPLTVFAIAGDRKTKTAHFVTCKLVPKIQDERFEWFKNLADIKSSGFDTCELCMPLVGDTRTLEVHKPLCAFVAKIKPINRKEIQSIKEATQQGFDGCKYCLTIKHTR
jgi:hypothetical protein